MRVRSNPYLVLAALWVMVFSVTSQTMIMAPMLPRIAEQLRIPESRLGTLVTGYGIAVGVVALIAGPISDKVGRRRMLLAGTGAMALALVAHGAASGYIALVAVRVLAGAGGGMLTGAAAAYVGDYFSYERRGWANGWVMSGMAVGQIVGIPLGTLLAARWGFRLPFLLFAGTMALAFLLVWWFLPDPEVEHIRGKLSLRESLRHYRAMIRTPAVAAVTAAFFGIFWSTSVYTLYLPTWLEDARSATAGQIATLFAIGGVATVLAGPAAGKWSDRIGRKGLIIAASLGLAGLMLATTFVVAKFWVAYVLFFALMALVATRSSPLQALMTAIVPEAQRGSLMSLTMAVGQFGVGAGAAVAGPAYGVYGYLSNTIIAAVSVLLTALLVWKFLSEPRPDSGSAQSRRTQNRPGAEIRSRWQSARR